MWFIKNSKFIENINKHIIFEGNFQLFFIGFSRYS